MTRTHRTPNPPRRECCCEPHWAYPVQIGPPPRSLQEKLRGVRPGGVGAVDRTPEQVEPPPRGPRAGAVGGVPRREDPVPQDQVELSPPAQQLLENEPKGPLLTLQEALLQTQQVHEQAANASWDRMERGLDHLLESGEVDPGEASELKLQAGDRTAEAMGVSLEELRNILGEPENPRHDAALNALWLQEAAIKGNFAEEAILGYLDEARRTPEFQRMMQSPGGEALQSADPAQLALWVAENVDRDPEPVDLLKNGYVPMLEGADGYLQHLARAADLAERRSQLEGLYMPLVYRN